MAHFRLSIDASATYGFDAPTLEILVGGIVVSSALVTSMTGVGTNTLEFDLEYSGTEPSSFSFRFNDGSGEGGRTVTLEQVRVNGQSVDTVYISMLTLNQNDSANVDTGATDHLYGRTPPTAGDLDPVTHNGTGGDDTINGTTSGDDVIDGSGGNDRLRGVGGDDAILGGAGNDTIFGEAGNDIVLGGTGNDMIFGNDGDDLLHGEEDGDYLIGGAGNDLLNGGAGNDYLLGGDDSDILYGEDGDDLLSGDAGDDYLYGDAGVDTIIGGAGNDTLYGGLNNDYLIGESGDDTIFGEDGNDEIVAGSGLDTVDGGAGDDTIFGEDGADTINGGNDNDAISGGDGDDTLNGDAGADNIMGGNGADTINGGTGNDTLHGHGLDATTISTLLYANPNLVYSEQSGSFYQFVSGPVTWDVAQSAAQASVFNGLNGHLVTITSAAENDFVYQLALDNGATTAIGASGNRIWLGASDVVSDQDWVWQGGPEAGLQFSTGSTSENNFYENWGSGQPNNSGGSQVYGTMWFNGGSDDSTWDDRDASDGHNYVIEWESGLMNADNAIDTLNGGDGDDVLYGYGGNDELYGDADNDLLFGGEGNDNLYGGTGADVLLGGVGDDTADGGTGNDILYGDSETASTIVMESGRTTVTQTNATEWHSVTFSASIQNAVIKMFAEDVTGDPFTTRVRNVTDTGFEFQLDEFDYQDGSTALENISWLAVSSGSYTLDNGMSIQAGYTTATNENTTAVNFNSTMSNAIVFSQVSSDNELSAVVTRNSAVTNNGFTVQMQEEEANANSHATEDIGWIAIESGGSVGVGMLAGTTGDVVSHTTTTVNFGGTFGSIPVFIADMQTTDGGDTSYSAGSAGVSTTQADVYIDEEESADTEISHTQENVGYVALEAGTYTASTFVNGSDVLRGSDGDDVLYADAANTPASASQGTLADAIIADNPVGYWRLNDSTGTTAVDLGSASGIDGVYTNGPTLGQTALYLGGQTSVDFDGTNDYVAIPNSSQINTAAFAERTIELVFNADTTAGRQVLWEEGGGTNCFVIYIDSGQLYVNARDSGEYGPFTISTAISAGQTYHVAMVFDSNTANTVTGYLDGTAFGSGVTNTDMDSHSGAIGIGAMNNAGYFHDGAQSGTGYYFNGRISDVALYNRALSSTEVQEHSDIVGGLLSGAAPVVDDTLYGGDGLDVLYGGSGRDSFVFESANAFNDVDQIYNYTYAERDALDISDLLSGYNPGTDDINDFVQLTEVGNDTFIGIDTNGTVGGSSYTNVAQIMNVTGMDVDNMEANEQLIV